MLFKKKAVVNNELQEAEERDIFYYRINGQTYTFDPLQTYCNLKEIGFEAFGQKIKGVLSGDPRQTQMFIEAMQKVFGVQTREEDKNGLTILELADLYIKFFSFINALKKKYILLADFAPSMEQEWSVLRTRKSTEQPASEEKATSSDSQNQSQPPQPQVESQPTTEPVEQSED